MYDLISIGNISIDMFFKGDSLTYEGNRFQLAIGGKYFVDAFHQSLGGGGANVAIGARRHGLKTAVIGKLGDNAFKQIMLTDLQSVGVDTSLCQTEKGYMNISSILLTPEGERSIINYETQHMHLFEKASELNKLLNAKGLYLGNLPDVSFTQREELLSHASKKGMQIFVNLGVKDCRRPIEQIERFMKHVNVMIMNGYEFAELVKDEYKHISFAKNPVKKYPFFEGKTVIITDGEKGSYGYRDGEVIFQEAVPVRKVVDTTGAGDAYTSAFIAVYLLSQDLEKAMNRGAHYAVRILGKIGAN